MPVTSGNFGASDSARSEGYRTCWHRAQIETWLDRKYGFECFVSKLKVCESEKLKLGGVGLAEVECGKCGGIVTWRAASRAGDPEVVILRDHATAPSCN